MPRLRVLDYPILYHLLKTKRTWYEGDLGMSTRVLDTDTTNMAVMKRVNIEKK